MHFVHSEVSVKLGEKGQFELTILTSFPGSGNTWTRLLLENASGYYTGRVLSSFCYRAYVTGCTERLCTTHSGENRDKSNKAR